MELGCCVTPEQLPLLTAAGGDYAELTVAGAVMGSEEATFARLVEQIGASPIKPRAFNVFLPGDRTIVGPAVDREWLKGYSQEALTRIARLSGSGAIVVLGSGRSRSIPADFDRATALDQFADFIGQLGALAEPLGITIALEHLRSAESNVFTSLRESGDFLRERDLPNVRLLVDLYHLMEEDEPLNTIDEYADLLVHAHVADSERKYPGTGTYPIAPFFNQLLQNGYTGKCSIECRWNDFPAEIDAAMMALREASKRG